MFAALGIMLFLLYNCHETNAIYKVGVGRGDCTGPVAEIAFMGYAKFTQKGCGLHLRQFARAYIFDDGINKVAFVTVDACMINHPLRKAVLENLEKTYGNTYTTDNLILSGTHTHGGPGGFMKDVGYDLSVLGFLPETFNALVNGIVRAITQAAENMVDANILLNSGELLDSNINRSPASYTYNPQKERDQYKYNVDKDMVQIRIVRTSDNVTIGAINWFPVHPTSMNNTNCLVTSDNLGYASILLEKSMNIGDLPGKGPFVGAFASTNMGDVSPNTKGPICINTGKECEYTHSTCDGKNEFCIASGPGKDMFESTEIIATNMYKKAKELLFDTNATEVTGKIEYIHRFFDMPNEKTTFELENKTTVEVQGCLPAMGYGFAAGTTDGPGAFDFKQGNTNSSNIFWNIVRDFIVPPTEEDKKCHSPKPILLMTGRIRLPYEWQPRVVSSQLLKIGQIILSAVPGEFTTMSGRRLKKAVREEIISNGGPQDTFVIITGQSNVYSSYIATTEEYQLQRYEGASTIFGPYTLPLYLNIYKELAYGLIKGQKIRPNETEPSPYDFPNTMLSLVTPVVSDDPGSFWHTFGHCDIQPKEFYRIGDIVSATFISGHPRNNHFQEKTFLTIEKQEIDDWKVVATDADWETRFIWKRKFIAESRVEILWEIREHVQPGIYRIQHFGCYKTLFKKKFYSGTSNSFTVTK